MDMYPIFISNFQDTIERIDFFWGRGEGLLYPVLIEKKQHIEHASAHALGPAGDQSSQGRSLGQGGGDRGIRSALAARSLRRAFGVLEVAAFLRRTGGAQWPPERYQIGRRTYRR